MAGGEEKCRTEKWNCYQNEYFATFRHRLANMRTSKDCTDVVLVCQDGTEFPAHSLVLSAASPYFSSKFSEDPKKNRIEFEGIAPDALKVALDFLYMEDLSEIGGKSDDLLPVLKAATEMQIDSLVQYCYDTVRKRLSVTCFADLWNIAVAHQLDDMIEKVPRFLARKFAEAHASADFLKLEFEQLKEVITSAELQVTSSDMILGAVLNWAKHEPETRKLTIIELIPMLDLGSLSNCYWQSIFTAEFLVRSSLQLMQSLQFSSTCERFHLVAFGKKGDVHQLQSYDYRDQNWSPVVDLPFNINRGAAYFSHMSRIYFIGGEEKRGQLSSMVVKFDMATLKVMQLPRMNEKRWKPAAIELQGKLYVVGGIDNNDQYTNTMEAFDSKENQWRYFATPLVSRWNPVMVSLFGNLYLVGGYEVFNSDNASNYTCAFVERYNPETDRWDQITELPYELQNRQKLYVASFSGKLCAMNNTTQLHLYDVRLNSWSIVVTNNAPSKMLGLWSQCTLMDVLPILVTIDHVGNVYQLRFNETRWTELPNISSLKKITGCLTLVFPNSYCLNKLRRTKLVAFGKKHISIGDYKQNVMQSFSPHSETWLLPAVEISAHLGNGTKFVRLGSEILIFMSATEIYKLNPKTGWIECLPRLQEPRSNVSLAEVSGKVYALGGTDNREQPTDIVECYDSGTDRWKSVSSMKVARIDALAMSLDECIFVIDGETGGRLVLEKYATPNDQWTVISTPYDGVPDARCIGIATCQQQIYIIDNISNREFRIYNPLSDQWTLTKILNGPAEDFGSWSLVSVADNLPYLFVFSDNVPYLYEATQNTWRTLELPSLNRILSAITIPG